MATRQYIAPCMTRSLPAAPTPPPHLIYWQVQQLPQSGQLQAAVVLGNNQDVVLGDPGTQIRPDLLPVLPAEDVRLRLYLTRIPLREHLPPDDLQGVQGSGLTSPAG